MKEQHSHNLYIDTEEQEEKLVHTKPMLYYPHERPKSISQWFLLSLQHVFAMFGSNVLGPLLINQIAGTVVFNNSMALFASGIGTLIYIICTRAKVPVYIGSSFAYITATGVAFSNYGNSAFLGLLCAGFLYVLASGIVWLCGNKWLETILPSVVVGPMIIIIGLSLAPSAVQNAGLDPSSWNTTNYPYWIAIIIAMFTFFVTAFLTLQLKGFLKIISLLLGVIIGYIFAIIIDQSTSYSIVNWNLITDTSKWQWYPSFKFMWQGDLNFAPILMIAPLAFITMAEHIGDHTSLSYIVGQNYLKDPGLQKTLLGDGLATMTSAFIGGPANTTYGENTSIVGITRVASVWTTGLAAIFAIIMAFIAPVNQIISMLPKPVMAGISMILFGFIATNGIKVLINDKVDFENFKNILIVSFMLVLGLGGAIISWEINGSKMMINGMAIAALFGIVLNLILPDTPIQFKTIKEKIKKIFRKK